MTPSNGNGNGRAGGVDPLEGLLQDALHPVDPPVDLAGFEERIAAKVERIADLAEEFGEGEKLALRDPRSWVAPAATGAVVVLGASAAAIAFIGKRRRGAQGRAGKLFTRIRP